jgi:hypothetical protein
MLKRLAVTTSVLVAGVAAHADISAYVEPVYEGFLTEYPDTYVFCYDLMVEITGEDAWVVAGGPTVTEPWIHLYGGVFFQHPMGVPDPRLFWRYPDLRYTSFYTTHLGWPNTAELGVMPGFAFGPADTPTTLNADWFWTPDGNDYPGDFTIARFTVIPDDPNVWCAEIDMQIGSRECGVSPFTWSAVLSGCCPADLDGDRDVDVADLAELLGNYGATGGATYWQGDLDGDDDVDLADLAEMLSQYGIEC